LNKVNFLEVFEVGWLKYVKNRYDIFVVEMAK